MLIISKFNHLRLNIHHYFNQKLKRIIQPFQFLVIQKLIICYTNTKYFENIYINKTTSFSNPLKKTNMILQQSTSALLRQSANGGRQNDA